MYQEFLDIDTLLKAVQNDKGCTVGDKSSINRYPLRFVLFDNFDDAREFMNYMNSQVKCQFKNVQDWLDEDFPDTLISSTRLATNIQEFVDNSDPNYDYILSPFSELSRFYNHTFEFSEFNTLVRTIKGIETSLRAQQTCQRIYIPVIGQEGKFAAFKNDNQIFLWYQKSLNEEKFYNLILVNGTSYGISNIESKCTVVDSVGKWLKLWREPNQKQYIFSTSKALYVNAKYAQPDNAFKIYKCDNVYQVLTKGLGLKFGEIEYNDKEDKFWNELASKIEINNFSFQTFCNKYFGIYDLANYNVFINAWFDFDSDFDRWLLTKYYLDKFCNLGYLCQALRNMNEYITRDLVKEVALCIFKSEHKQDDLEERMICLNAIAEHNGKLIQTDEDTLISELEKLSKDIGYSNALKYISNLTIGEKRLVLQWIADEKIRYEEINNYYPDLYNYLLPLNSSNSKWYLEYIEHYKLAKIKNQYTKEVESAIKKINASPVEFDKWYQNLKTVPTLLDNRNDIDIFYWIDGLGIDWIPYILNHIKKHGGIYVNEVHIGRAKLPTVTSVNKDVLKEMADKLGKTLVKIGNLDELAHKSTTSYPDSVIDELQIVKDSIDEIIDQYGDKKIAIVSDHGMTSLAQLCDGIPLYGYDSDHQGRCAKYISGVTSQDNNYFCVPGSDMICALNHHSICRKTPTGQNAHGGCTPEEVLVPILILSSTKEASTYNVKLITQQLAGIAPIVFDIKGVTILDNIKVVYSDKKYDVKLNTANGYFETIPIAPIPGKEGVDVIIGDYKKSFSIKVIMGLEEDDMGI